MNLASLPIGYQAFFWDFDFQKAKLQDRPQYVIQRLLEKGDEKAIRWLRKNIGDIQIKKTIIERRGFSPKTASFWSSFFNIPYTKVKCLQKPYLAQHRIHWPY